MGGGWSHEGDNRVQDALVVPIQRLESTAKGREEFHDLICPRIFVRGLPEADVGKGLNHELFRMNGTVYIKKGAETTKKEGFTTRLVDELLELRTVSET